MERTSADESTPRSRWRRLAWVLVPALLFLGLLTTATFRRGGPPAPGDAAPAFSAPMLGADGSLSLAELRGRPVVLNFWASWCIPCKDEAPILQRAHERFGDEVTFVGIDIRDARTDALKFVDEYGIDYLQVRDERLEIYHDYGLTGQPETFFIDADGNIVEHVAGPLFEDDLVALLDRLLEEA